MALNLDALEKRLQRLIEVHLPQYIPLRKSENRVAHQLVTAMQAHLDEREGKKIAPNTYTISAHPKLIEKWQEDASLISNFRETLKIFATETAVEFDAPLAFSLASDPQLNPDEVRIIVSQRVEEIADTHGMEAQENNSTEQIPENAFLIIHGTKVFSMEKAVINIGRRMENDLIIDDPRVSRNHAQLRAVNSRYVIFDLNSTGGTYVNSQRAHQSVLYPGDVISLAGVPLIYGQDNPPQQAGVDETTPTTSAQSSSERPTALLRDTADLEEVKKARRDHKKR